MKNNNLFTLLLLILSITQFANADIPPASDEMRMTADLIINTDADLSDYRFFLAFPVSVREVEIKSKGNTALASGGGGAAFSSGNLFAIPTKELKSLSKNPTNQELSLLIKSVEEEFVKGIKLVNHQFSATIKATDRAKWTSPTYKLERDGDTLKLTKLVNISPKISLEEEAQINSNKSSIFTIVAGIFIALGILAIGVFLFRKVLKKG